MKNAIENLGIGKRKSTPPIIAAGAVVLGAQHHAGKIALVRRHRYDGDVSLPKGKLKEGETIEAGAIREVEEEIGQRLEIQAFAGLTRYLAAGVPKVVFYFIMHANQTDCAPRDKGEVTEIIWKSADEAIEMLSYPKDQLLLRRLRKSRVI